jgi:Arc/MetJ-type ribon-helix-helix transcriptional regulator
VKIGATVDPHLLRAVDAWVEQHPESDRSKVIDEALQLWYQREQERAIEEQFTSPSDLDPAAWETWRSVRWAAAAQRLGRPRGSAAPAKRTGER